VGTYKLTTDDEFVEYQQTSFGKENIEDVLEDWLEKNPHVLIEGQQVLYICRQVQTKLGKAIDLLAVNNMGDVLVIELKKDRTPRDVIAQALEYAASVEPLRYEELDEIAMDYFERVQHRRITLEEAYLETYKQQDVAISWNTEQRIFVVAQQISSEIASVASYLRRKNIDIRAIQFNYFKSASGERLVTTQVIVGTEPRPVDLVPQPRKTKIDESIFLERCRQGGHNNAEELYFKVKALCEKRIEAGDLVNWGVSGYSYRMVWEGYPGGEVIFVSYGDGGLSLWLYIVEKCGEAGQVYLNKLRNIKTFGSKLDRGNQPYFSTDTMTSDDIDAFISAVSELSSNLSE